jgi:hypothetical protein
MKKTAIAVTVVFVLLVASFLAGAKSASGAPAAENTWIQKSPMQQARADLGVAVVNGKIYSIGGLVLKYQDKTTIQSIDVATNEEYNPSTNTWNYKTSMPTPRDSFAIAVYQNKIYCIGGSTGFSREHGQTLTTTNEVYDPSTNTWENKTAVPTARILATANVVNGKIYVMGGYPNGTLIDVYDPATDSWTTLPTPIEPFGPSEVYNNKIYVLGGTKIYDPNTDSWSFGAALPKSFSTSGSVERSGVTIGFMAPPRMYVFFGVPQGNQVYDPVTDSWMVGADVPTSRGGFSVAVVDDLIYVIGGITITHPKTIPMDAPFGSYGVANYYSTVEQYTPFGYGTVPPVIDISSPEFKNYSSGEVFLNFTLNRAVDWVRYSLDGQENVTVTGNSSLSGLTVGWHNVTVYAKDEFGNTGSSQTITFTIAKQEPFPTVLVIPVSAALAAVGIAGALLIYRKKHKSTSSIT